MLATARAAPAPLASFAHRQGSTKPVGARFGNPARVVGVVVRRIDSSKPRPGVGVVRASSNSALGDVAAKAAKVVAAPAKAKMAIPTLATVLGTAYSFPFLWALSIVPCLLGLVNPVYVFSVGYGLSVAAQGIGLLAAASASGVWISNLCLAHLLGAVF